MSQLFKHFMIEGGLVLGLLFGQQVTGCGSTPPPPKPTKTASPTDENGREIEVPIPTGCKGKITNRMIDSDGSGTITYYTDAKCSKTRDAKITMEQDLNSTCEPDDYYPLCLTPDKTEPPGIRLPTDPGN